MIVIRIFNLSDSRKAAKIKPRSDNNRNRIRPPPDTGRSKMPRIPMNYYGLYSKFLISFTLSIQVFRRQKY